MVIYNKDKYNISSADRLPLRDKNSLTRYENIILEGSRWFYLGIEMVMFIKSLPGSKVFRTSSATLRKNSID